MTHSRHATLFLAITLFSVFSPLTSADTRFLTPSFAPTACWSTPSQYSACGWKGTEIGFLGFSMPAYFQQAHLYVPSGTYGTSTNSQTVFGGCKASVCTGKTYEVMAFGNQCQTVSKLTPTNIHGYDGTYDVTRLIKTRGALFLYGAYGGRYTCPADWKLILDGASDTIPPFSFSIGAFSQVGSATDTQNVEFQAIVTGAQSGTCQYAWTTNDLLNTKVKSVDWDGNENTLTGATIDVKNKKVSWACDFESYQEYHLSIFTPPVTVTPLGWQFPKTSQAGFSAQERSVKIENPSAYAYTDIHASLSCPNTATCSADSFVVASIDAYGAALVTQTALFLITTPTPTPLPRVITDPSAPQPKGMQWFASSATPATPSATQTLSFAATDASSRVFFVAKPDTHEIISQGSVAFAVFDGNGNAIYETTLVSSDGTRQTLAADEAGGFIATLGTPGEWKIEWVRSDGKKETATIDALAQQTALFSGAPQQNEPLFGTQESPNAPDATNPASWTGVFTLATQNSDAILLFGAAAGVLLAGVGVARRKNKTVTPVVFGNELVYSIPAESAAISGEKHATRLRVLIPPSRRVRKLVPKVPTESLVTGTLVEWEVEKPFGKAKTIEFRLSVDPQFGPKERLPAGELV